MDDDSIWEAFKALRKERQETKAYRRDEFEVLYRTGRLPGDWKQCHETHYQYNLNGDLLDYWPGPQKWRWRGKTMSGDVFDFIIANQE